MFKGGGRDDGIFYLQRLLSYSSLGEPAMMVPIMPSCQQFPVYPKDPIQPMSEDSFGAISCPMYRV
jgi:hypothetical protein